MASPMGRRPATADRSMDGSAPGSGLRRALPWIFALGVLTFSVGILATAYMGSFMRLSGDDYCYGGVVADYGFVRGQIYSYLDHPPYHGNRYSLTFFSGLASLVGPTASAAWPGLTLAGWLAAATWCGTLLARWARLPRPHLLGILGAASVIFLTVYQASDRSQSVYWRSANIPYLTPLVLDALLLGLMLWQGRLAKPRPTTLVAIFTLAFVVGGFSEAAAAFQITWLMLGLGAAVGLRRRLEAGGRPMIYALTAAAFGAGLSLAALAASPYTQSALGSVESHAAPLPLLVTALRGGVGFLRETLQGLPLPTAVTLGLGSALGLLLGLERQGARRGTWRGLAAAFVLLLAGSVVLTAAVLSPSLYANGALPDARALVAARYAMVLAFLGIGLAAGFTAGTVMPPEMKRSALLTGVLAAAVALAAVYPLWGARQIVTDVSTYRRWANAWDERHAEILRARESGEVDLHVMLIDHIIPSVSELSDDPASWYNMCAARFYGAGSITADLPGWDD